ncbi:hypothetical protein ABEB36_015761 [Hypothenemus hampei]|uniref:General transcription factor 3C polypeptide 2 n=1 Tax=Hypothenemus hampei TaxID=57062 RepID=A0ABD1DZP3_HYPHA
MRCSSSRGGIWECISYIYIIFIYTKNIGKSIFPVESDIQRSTKKFSRVIYQGLIFTPLRHTIINQMERVICGVCKKEMDQSKWKYHKYKSHNNLAWREGDQPLNLKDDGVVRQILNQLYKSRKPFHCEICKQQKKSVLGYLSHKSICQRLEIEVKNVKVSCTICHRKVLPVSMNSHMKIHDKPDKTDEIKLICFETNNTELDIKRPRRAATQALQMIHILGGESNIRSIFRDCLFNFRQAIKYQLDMCNEDEDKLFEFHEANRKRLRQKTKELLINKKTINNKPLFLIHPLKELKLIYMQAYDWMMSFCLEYYAQTMLFPNFRNVQPWLIVNFNVLNNYLPSVQESCDIRIVLKTTAKSKKSEEEEEEEEEKKKYFKLGLFEVHNTYSDQSTIFCGGPITSLAWLPTAYDRTDQTQILALATLNVPDQQYLVGKTYKTSALIQFYNCGLLNDFESACYPFLLFGLALNVGPIWHLEWCPSGCFSESRLGLLAIAASDSFVYIYCIDNYNNNNDRGLIYFGQPVVKLELESGEEKSYFATRISWSKAKGHRYLAVGYSNGVIALFDLELISSNLLHKTSCNTHVFLPLKTFQAHLSSITGLNLGHYDQGNRWLYSSSLDRSFAYWDLFTMTKVTSSRKYGIAEALWPIQWPTCITVEEETTFNDKISARTNIKSIRDILSPDSNWLCMTSSPSGIKTISFSDWLNLALYGGNSGELTGIFAHELFNVSKKQFKNSYTRCIFSVARLVNKKKSNQMDNYQDASENFALLFEDFPSDNISTIPNSKTNNLKTVKIDKYTISDYPMRAVNKIALNQNRQSHSYYAVGYQMGFVRIGNLKFIKGNFNQTIFSFNTDYFYFTDARF